MYEINADTTDEESKHDGKEEEERPTEEYYLDWTCI